MENQPIVILYGSQTGCGEQIAKSLPIRIAEKNLKAVTYCMKDYASIDFSKVRILIIVVSSTGVGDPPDNAISFQSYVRKQKDQWPHIQFAICGLGDSNYASFQENPSIVDRIMKATGAVPLLARKEIDESKGLDDQVEEWIDDLLFVLSESACLEHLSRVDLASDSSATQPSSNETVETITSTQPSSKKPNPLLKRKKKKELQSSEGKPVALMAPNSTLNAIPLDEADDVEWEQRHLDKGYYKTIISSAKWLTSNESQKHVMEIQFKFPAAVVVQENENPLLINGGFGPSGREYKPGDSVDLIFENNANEVDLLLKRLSFDPQVVYELKPLQSLEGSFPSHLPRKAKLFDLFSRCLDLSNRSVQSKVTLRCLAYYCTDAAEKDKLADLASSTPAGRDRYKKEILDGAPSLLEVLRIYSSSNPPLDRLLSCLFPLLPRSYSLTCAPAVFVEEGRFAFSLVQNILPPLEGDDPQRIRVFKGVATNQLVSIAHACFENVEKRKNPGIPDEDDPLNNIQSPKFAKDSNGKPFIWIKLRPSSLFHPPSDLSSPLIMVGPGTGVAPFLGFLQHRKWWKSQNVAKPVGEAWLFFGCRYQKHDYIYRDELESFAQDGTLQNLITAFSRDSEKKVYVQTRLLEKSAQIYRLLFSRNAYLFVCGDAKDMTQGVLKSLWEIVQTNGNTTENVAKDRISELQKSGKIVFDVWA